jgi:hopene-associated glycosyltransferase HpnB
MEKMRTSTFWRAAGPWRLAGFACAGVWTYFAFFRGGFWRLRERLQAAGDSAARVGVTAVIPARNEEDTIAYPVESLGRQRFKGDLRVVVADDESDDGTADVARASGAEVVRVLPRPGGWKGKLWAVSSGIRTEEGKPDFFLLTDADIEYAGPGAIQALLDQAARGFDLVSVMVRLRCRSGAEKFLVPAFVFFFFKLYPPAWVASERNAAAAAGGCMLIRREMLERIGGVESIRDALIDDCALAQRVRAAGGRVWLGVSDIPIRSVRAYGEARDIRAMISRSAFAQLRHSGWLLAGTIAGMSVTYFAPVALLFAPDALARGLGAAAWLTGAVLFTPAVRIYRAPRWTAFCLPGIAAFYLMATVESALLYWSGRGGAWKGRIQDSAPSASH